VNQAALSRIEAGEEPLAVISVTVPLAKPSIHLLRREKVETVVVDMNLDTVQGLTAQGGRRSTETPTT